jgi:crossover junction endodeoxyribonuclease RuvC
VDTHLIGQDDVSKLPLPENIRAVRRLAGEILEWAEPCDLVAVEGLALAARGGANVERVDLWRTVVGRLLDHGRPVVVVGTKQRPKWATGNGNASKTAVAVAAGRMFPDAHIPDDNVADALILASIGVQLLDGPLPCEVTAYRREVAAKLEVISEQAA